MGECESCLSRECGFRWVLEFKTELGGQLFIACLDISAGVCFIIFMCVGVGGTCE